MAEKNDATWLKKYLLLKDFVEVHKHLPSKHKVENRGLLNWWKYNQRLIKRNQLCEEKLRLLKQLNDMRTQKHKEL